jgi:carboxyl-terminal processing protease
MISITVVREKIKIPSVYSEDLEEEIGYISINMFGEDTSKEFHKSIQEFRNKS